MCAKGAAEAASCWDERSARVRRRPSGTAEAVLKTGQAGQKYAKLVISPKQTLSGALLAQVQANSAAVQAAVAGASVANGRGMKPHVTGSTPSNSNCAVAVSGVGGPGGPSPATSSGRCPDGNDRS